MPATPHIRTSRAKDDDQIAFENGSSFEEVCSYQKALDWYAEVKPMGGYLDTQASSCRVAILHALGELEESVRVGMAAAKRMRHFSIALLVEVSRAIGVHLGPEKALAFCREWLRYPDVSRLEDFWYSSACFAAQSGQFGRSLRYFAKCLRICDGKSNSDILLDRDLAPLWHHLENDSLSPDEILALSDPVWEKAVSEMPQVRGDLSFESLNQVPPSLRGHLRLNTRHMVWRLHRDTPPPKRTAFDAWCQAVRDASLVALQTGLRKALAQSPLTDGECA